MNYSMSMKNFKNKEVVKYSYIPGKYSSCKVIKKLNSNKVVTKKIIYCHQDKGGELLFLIIFSFVCGVVYGYLEDKEKW